MNCFLWMWMRAEGRGHLSIKSIENDEKWSGRWKITSVILWKTRTFNAIGVRKFTRFKNGKVVRRQRFLWTAKQFKMRNDKRFKHIPTMHLMFALHIHYQGFNLFRFSGGSFVTNSCITLTNTSNLNVQPMQANVPQYLILSTRSVQKIRGLFELRGSS